MSEIRVWRRVTWLLEPSMALGSVPPVWASTL
jgi:hypothetical protein